MSKIRKDFVQVAFNRATEPMDANIYDNFHKQFGLMKQRALADESLTKDERTEVLRRINENYDRYKILYNEGTKRICENCNQECLATTFCELCVRNYLKENFPNWTSGNDNIDSLIRSCQLNTFMPNAITEWIPYDNLQNIKYLTEGGFSKIYTAKWIDGQYIEWDSKNQQLTRTGVSEVILKRLENVENANQSWLEEVCNIKYLNKNNNQWVYLQFTNISGKITLNYRQ